MKAILFLTLLPLGLGVLQAKKPNVLFILIDDMGAHDLSNEGSEFYESPNVDRIANEGMKFTRGYATCQVCSPSRASLLTDALSWCLRSSKRAKSATTANS